MSAGTERGRVAKKNSRAGVSNRTVALRRALVEGNALEESTGCGVRCEGMHASRGYLQTILCFVGFLPAHSLQKPDRQQVEEAFTTSGPGLAWSARPTRHHP